LIPTPVVGVASCGSGFSRELLIVVVKKLATEAVPTKPVPGKAVVAR
jgi:hypothetical protein